MVRLLQGCPWLARMLTAFLSSRSPYAFAPAQMTEELAAAEARRPAVIVAQPTLRLDLPGALQQAPARMDMCSECAKLLQKVSAWKWAGVDDGIYGIYSYTAAWRRRCMLVAVRLDSTCWCMAHKLRLGHPGSASHLDCSEPGHPSARLTALHASACAAVSCELNALNVLAVIFPSNAPSPVAFTP